MKKETNEEKTEMKRGMKKREELIKGRSEEREE